MKPRQMLNNYVMIKLDPAYDSVKLSSGLELYIDLSFEPEKHATVTGEVICLPRKLYYSGEPNKGMPWLTDMEVREGDQVIIYYLSVVNALKKENQMYLIEGEDRYIFITYNNIYAVVRDGKVIPVNGYVLIEPCEDPSITEDKERMKRLGLAFVVTEKRTNTNVTYGRVKYLGTPNREYVDDDFSDEGVDIAEGDVVIIRRIHDIPLQYEQHQKVNEGKPLLRVQRRNLFAKI